MTGVDARGRPRLAIARADWYWCYFRQDWQLSNYHILWEADWEDMPTDPILLKHLSGALYAVLADLTDLEKAVMRK